VKRSKKKPEPREPQFVDFRNGILTTRGVAPGFFECATCGLAFPVRLSECPDRRCPSRRNKIDMTLPVEERFWLSVDKKSGEILYGGRGRCWLWIDLLNAQGYGQFRAVGKAVLAHRFAYEMKLGPIGEGLQLDHLCRITACVNPDHLEPVTRKENLRRAYQRGLDLRRVAARTRNATFVAEVEQWLEEWSVDPGPSEEALQASRSLRKRPKKAP
jgi:hypothetical protein